MGFMDILLLINPLRASKTEEYICSVGGVSEYALLHSYIARDIHIWNSIETHIYTYNNKRI